MEGKREAAGRRFNVRQNTSASNQEARILCLMTFLNIIMAKNTVAGLDHSSRVRGEWYGGGISLVFLAVASLEAFCNLKHIQPAAFNHF